MKYFELFCWFLALMLCILFVMPALVAIFEIGCFGWKRSGVRHFFQRPGEILSLKKSRI